jgi:hypothetical protein
MRQYGMNMPSQAGVAFQQRPEPDQRIRIRRIPQHGMLHRMTSWRTRIKRFL